MPSIKSHLNNYRKYSKELIDFNKPSTYNNNPACMEFVPASYAKEENSHHHSISGFFKKVHKIQINGF